MQIIQSLTVIVAIVGGISLISYGLGKVKPGLVFLVPGLLLVIGLGFLLSVINSGSWEGLFIAIFALLLIGGGLISGIISLIMFLGERKQRIQK